MLAAPAFCPPQPELPSLEQQRLLTGAATATFVTSTAARSSTTLIMPFSIPIQQLKVRLSSWGVNSSTFWLVCSFFSQIQFVYNDFIIAVINLASIDNQFKGDTFFLKQN